MRGPPFHCALADFPVVQDSMSKLPSRLRIIGEHDVEFGFGSDRALRKPHTTEGSITMAGNRKNTVLCLTLLGAFLAGGSIAKAAPYTLDALHRMLKTAQQQVKAELADLDVLQQVIEVQSDYVNKLRGIGETTKDSNVANMLLKAEAELARLIDEARETKNRILDLQAYIAWIVEQIENFQDPRTNDSRDG